MGHGGDDRSIRRSPDMPCSERCLPIDNDWYCRRTARRAACRSDGSTPLARVLRRSARLCHRHRAAADPKPGSRGVLLRQRGKTNQDDRPMTGATRMDQPCAAVSSNHPASFHFLERRSVRGNEEQIIFAITTDTGHRAYRLPRWCRLARWRRAAASSANVARTVADIRRSMGDK